MNDILMNAGKTACYGKAGLAEGTNNATFKTAAAVNFGIKGLAYSKGATDNLAFSAGHTALGNSEHCLFLVQVDGNGNVSTKQSNIVADAVLDAGANTLQWPVPDADKCPIGGIKVETDSSHTFTPGTTDLGAAGITDTYYDFIGGFPIAPQVS